MSKGQSMGPSTDASNQPVIDPTLNVRELTSAEARRQDDLREASEKSLRREMELRAEFGEKLHRAEAGRLDEIRRADQGQVERAALVQAEQATALATTLAATAQEMRSQVADIRQFQWGSEGGNKKTGDARLWITLGVSILAVGTSMFFGAISLGIAIYVATR